MDLEPAWARPADAGVPFVLQVRGGKRHPELPGAAIELGPTWVPVLPRNMDHALAGLADAARQRFFWRNGAEFLGLA